MRRRGGQRGRRAPTAGAAARAQTPPVRRATRSELPGCGSVRACAHLRVQLVAWPALQGVRQVPDDDVKLARVVLSKRGARPGWEAGVSGRFEQGSPRIEAPPRHQLQPQHRLTRALLLLRAARWRRVPPLPRAHLELRAGVVVDELQLWRLKRRLVGLQVRVAEVTHHLVLGTRTGRERRGSVNRC